MPEKTRASRGNRGRFTFSSVLSLAFWRWRQTGFLMSITTIGMIAAVVIICAVPLFTDVMNTAGLRSMLLAKTENAEIEANIGTAGLSTAIATDVRTQFETLIKDSLGKDASSLQVSQFSTISQDFDFAMPMPPKEEWALVLYGVDMQEAVPHLGKMQGKLPTIPKAIDTFDVLLHKETAKYMKVDIGAEIPLQVQFSTSPASLGGDSYANRKEWKLTARVTGFFEGDAQQASYWHDIDFKPITSQNIQSDTKSAAMTMVLPNESLFTLHDRLAKLYQVNALFSPITSYNLRWYYSLDLERLSIAELDDLIYRMANLRNTYEAYFGDTDQGVSISQPLFPYISSTKFSSPMFGREDNPSNLELFRHRVNVSRIPVAVLAIQIILLILFFVSLMTNLLVERQSDAIALLRSRGASSGQIFGALLTQCLILGLLAFGLGVPLAIAMVMWLSQRILPAQAGSALNIVTGNIPAIVQLCILYALGILLVVLITMCVSLFFAARKDVLAIRREAARANKRPLWQRLNLDVIAGVLALVSYGVSLYLTSLGDVLGGDSQSLVVAPLSIIAPFFLVLGCMLLFLRLFPLLLRLIAYMVSRGRGAVSMLALAQISRSPRQSMRMTMLLALATAFALFTLVYTSSETHHIQQITTYMTGADFSGQLSTTVKEKDLAKINTRFQRIPGIQATSSGFTTKAVGGKGGISMEVRAVDTTTFGRAVLWPSPAEREQGEKLLKQLAAQRQAELKATDLVLPVIIDTKTASELQLSKDDLFTIKIEELSVEELHCKILGVVPYIPTVNNRITLAKGSSVPGGVLLDYQTYHDIYVREIKKLKEASKDPFFTVDAPLINQVWMDAKDDAASLTTIRSSLNKSEWRLRNVVDRPAMLAQLTTDPLYLVLSGVLSIGTVTALLLALVGDLLASWLSARTRLTSFAVLRAIGTTPGEVAGVLTWEQIIIYVTGLLLGTGFGAMLSWSIIPTLTFTDLGTNVNQDQFYKLQSAFPVQVVVPPTLLFGLLVLAGLFILALIMMVRVVSMPVVSQALRLNED